MTALVRVVFGLSAVALLAGVLHGLGWLVASARTRPERIRGSVVLLGAAAMAAGMLGMAATDGAAPWVLLLGGGIGLEAAFALADAIIRRGARS